jgi:hypothetical protein
MDVLIFLRDLLAATFGQLVSLFAGIFIFGTIIHFVSHITFKSLERGFGRGGVYAVAWLGTPVHELGHALFCVIFLHRIDEIAFFKPEPNTGTLGYVNHRWSRWNPWQVLGNFFIGIGPVLLGGAALCGLFYLLVPDGARAWDEILAIYRAGGDFSFGGFFQMLGEASLVMLRVLFTTANAASWQFWLFLYLAVCIAANIRLSLADLKTAFTGLGCIVVPFLLLNLIGLLTSFDSESIIPLAAPWLGFVYGLLLLALVLAVIGAVPAYLTAATYYRLKHRLWLNPF